MTVVIIIVTMMIILGVLLNVREMDVETPGKCGTGLHREAIELYESLRWYLSFINQNSGQVASRLVKDSFIPGIQLGQFFSRPSVVLVFYLLEWYGVLLESLSYTTTFPYWYNS